MSNFIGKQNPAADDDFEQIERVGRGGFGEVWKAAVLNDKLAHQYRTSVVALKIPKDKDTEFMLRKEILTNAALTQQLLAMDSANLVRYYDFSSYRNQIVMVMEYVPGGSLRTLMVANRKPKEMPIERALAIAESMLNGIVAIHAGHVLHRDIKPENILMDGDEPKLADFGIARIINPLEKASTFTGTYPYMSPEQLNGRAEHSSDLWSFAVMLYEMLTGRLPWREVDPAPLMLEICNRQPRPPIDIRQEIPEPISEFIMTALEKSPRKRYPNAGNMLAALRQAKRQTSTGRTKADLDRVRQLVAEDCGGADIEKELAALLAKHPSDARFYLLIGEYHNRRQFYDKAITIFETGLAAVPDSAVLHWDLGFALQAKCQKRPAAEHLRRAMALGLDANLNQRAQMMLRVLEAE